MGLAHRSTSKGVLAILVAIAIAINAVYLPPWANAQLTAGSATADVAADKPATGMSIVNGMAQPVFAYSDAHAAGYTNAESELYRFIVYVETDYDTDRDGKCDLVRVYLQVPRAAVQSAYQAPVLFRADPYSAGMRASFDSFKFADASVDDGALMGRPAHRAAGEDKAISSESLALDTTLTKADDWNYELYGTAYPNGLTSLDYYLVRGFAVVQAAGLGTYGSEGIECCGTVMERDAFVDIVEWLHGTPGRHAFADAEGTIPVEADWSSGHVGMTGLSYPGAMCYEVATSGVEGLDTVVPVAGPSSWYDLRNRQGICADPTTSYNYTTVLADTCASRLFADEEAGIEPDAELVDFYQRYRGVLGDEDIIYARDTKTVETDPQIHLDASGKVVYEPLSTGGLSIVLGTPYSLGTTIYPSYIDEMTAVIESLPADDPRRAFLSAHLNTCCAYQVVLFTGYYTTTIINGGALTKETATGLNALQDNTPDKDWGTYSAWYQKFLPYVEHLGGLDAVRPWTDGIVRQQATEAATASNTTMKKVRQPGNGGKMLEGRQLTIADTRKRVIEGANETLILHLPVRKAFVDYVSAHPEDPEYRVVMGIYLQDAIVDIRNATVSVNDAIDGGSGQGFVADYLAWLKKTTSVWDIDPPESKWYAIRDADGNLHVAYAQDGTNDDEKVATAYEKRADGTKQAYKLAFMRTGKALEPKPTLTFAGATLVEGVDYTLAYADNVEAGTATVTITGRGNFEGDITQTFTIDQPQPDQAISYLCIAGDGATWTKGSGTSLSLTSERSTDESSTFAHFKGIFVDGLEIRSANYDAESGSVVLSLKPSWLETLSVGEHELAARFDDGTGSARFTVHSKTETSSAAGKGATSTASTAAKQTIPKAGDAILPVAAFLTLAIIACVVGLQARRKLEEPASDDKR